MSEKTSSLRDDLILPLILLGALGGLTWAMRGESGYGSSKGCIVAGVTLGTAWWYLAREPSGRQTRRYASGWILLAMTIGFGIAGDRGWMQWPSFFNGKLCIDYAAQKYVPIARGYGFLWLFLAGIPWAGMGACLLAWCGSGRPASPRVWVGRLGFGVAGAYLLGWPIYYHLPHVFLPLYDSLKEMYRHAYDPGNPYPNLKKLIRDNHEAMWQMGAYLGFLSFEALRRDKKNVTLIATVGVLNGIGWALLQNWTWANHLWPNAHVNFWRCWETTGGISIGISYAVAYYLVNRRIDQTGSETQRRDEPPRLPTGSWPSALGLSVLFLVFFGLVIAGKVPHWGALSITLAAFAIVLIEGSWLVAYVASALFFGWMVIEVMPPWGATALALAAVAFGFAYYVKANAAPVSERALWSVDGPILERWGAYAGLTFGLGLSLKNGLKGWANIYLGNEDYWNHFFWNTVGTGMIVVFMAVSAWMLLRPAPRNVQDDAFPRAYSLVWLVIIVQNILGQLVTGPLINPKTRRPNYPELEFNAYYVVLFLVTEAVVIYYRRKKGAVSVAVRKL